MTLSELNKISSADFTTALGAVFEHSPWIAEKAASERPFASLKDLHQAMCEIVRSSSLETQLKLINAHPDLAGKLAATGQLTSESAREQTAAGLGALTSGELEKFTRNNDAYRQKFAFPFIICARLSNKEAILQAFDKRLENDRETEITIALSEIYKIAWLRLEAICKNAKLSTHILDAANGCPAKGVRFELRNFDNGELLVSGTTNDQGRTDAPLLGGDRMKAGNYELLFFLGDYFRIVGLPLTNPPFLDQVPIRFAIADPEASYHVPLLATPWSYTTYLGS